MTINDDYYRLKVRAPSFLDLPAFPTELCSTWSVKAVASKSRRRAYHCHPKEAGEYEGENHIVTMGSTNKPNECKKGHAQLVECRTKI
jgi:hypothetical protein